MKPSNELIKRIPEPAALERPNEFTTPNSYNYGVDPNAETDVHMLDHSRYVGKRFSVVLGVMLLITPLALVYLASTPDTHQASPRVLAALDTHAPLDALAPYVFGHANDPVSSNTQLQIVVS